MKRLLATAIAFTTLGLLPVAAETAVQSTPDEDHSSIWLILNRRSLLSLPMKSLEQCEEQGAIFMSSERLDKHLPHRGFECLEGK
tara:strand:+ start:414 stop:668 length:255 start_codon:yes stop_codon:yes gene_type:complete